ncbi:hypothetical protein TRFO_24402 [Tritrichomonas foetus]|uniref:Uncharacterized protein n=1 Tax=Tritrichomonas foetus TaxID=1144522 RepID=A0A1J4KCH0_9EUKA|nr:hypothetical protein TRFO_24402 [Tritrichomonas foetus]|eukprot:OHT07388.1 hypothetical protein TRFO_24402 [Tritrichomonas foetus]
MTLSHAKPALISLNIRRTVDSLLTMDTSPDTIKNEMPKKIILKPKEETVIDHSEEISKIKTMLEQQCFEIVACNNKIIDARKEQKELLSLFHTRAETLENRLTTLSSILFQKVEDLNRRIDTINKTLTPKPILTSFLPPNDFGRITGLDAKNELLAYTTVQGNLVVLDRNREFKLLSSNQPFPHESLFSPVLINRQNTNGIFAITSARKLLFATPARSQPKQLIEGRVESYSVITDSIRHETYDIVTGHQGQMNFFTFQDNYNSVNLVGSVRKLNGIVSHIVTDYENEAIYALTSRRWYYTISSSTFGLVISHQFQNTPLQIQLSTVFIIISFAPNDIVILERNREKVSILTKFSIVGGLRSFYCGENHIFVITKNQQIERRGLCKPEESEIICEPDVADYDENEYIGTVFSDGMTIYLSHNNRISVWV